MAGYVRFPEKLAFLFQPKRYKVLYGGRGGGKSHAVAMALLIKGAKEKLRILCTREVQKSMRDSVHRLLKDKIVDLGLEDFYQVLDNEIRGANGTLIVFSGLQSHTVDSIKSFEGVDIVWVEEAHGVSKKSWDVLTPTIRKNGSEIWITLNPDMDTDETYQRFIASPDEESTVLCEINWSDNPFFPDTLNEERLKAQRSMSKEDYEHIWEGKPRSVSDGAIYRHEIASMVHENRLTFVPYDNSLQVHTVWDLGWNDSMSIILVQRGLNDVRVIGYIEDSHRTLDWYVSELDRKGYRYGTDFLPHDARTRNFQTGKSTEEILQEMGRNTIVLGSTNIEEGIRAARMMFQKCYFDKNNTTRLIECLKRYRRNINSKTGAATTPLHDEYSHGADSFRYLAQAVPLMKSSVEYEYVEQEASDWRL